MKILATFFRPRKSSVPLPKPVPVLQQSCTGHRRSLSDCYPLLQIVQQDSSAQEFPDSLSLGLSASHGRAVKGVVPSSLKPRAEGICGS